MRFAGIEGVPRQGLLPPPPSSVHQASFSITLHGKNLCLIKGGSEVPRRWTPPERGWECRAEAAGWLQSRKFTMEMCVHQRCRGRASVCNDKIVFCVGGANLGL